VREVLVYEIVPAIIGKRILVKGLIASGISKTIITLLSGTNEICKLSLPNGVLNLNNIFLKTNIGEALNYIVEDGSDVNIHAQYEEVNE
jgi:hypothetical protein